MAKITQKDLKKYLDELNEQELRAEIKELYRKFPLIKEYYQLELSTDSTLVVNDYKNKIRRYYFPNNRRVKRPKAAKMRELINSFKKVAPFTYDVIDLLFYQVEIMMEFTRERGYVSQGFYQTMISRYKEALQLIEQDQAKEEFRERSRKIAEESSFMNWGPQVDIKDLHIRCFHPFNPDTPQDPSADQ